MKRKTIALLSLGLCLALLTACGTDNAQDAATTPEDASEPVEEKEEEPAPEPEEEVPEEEPKEAEEETEEPEEENNAGTEFLALLQEEWNNGFVEGEGPRHSYYNSKYAFIHDGVVYTSAELISRYASELIPNDSGGGFLPYDIASKQLHEPSPTNIFGWSSNSASPFFMDGSLYYINYLIGDAYYSAEEQTEIYDYNSGSSNLVPFDSVGAIPFENGILSKNADNDSNAFVLSSYSLEKIADIPAPQRDAAHGLKEDVKLDFSSMFAADGTIYAQEYNTHFYYRLNTDTCEWESIGEIPYTGGSVFCGKYLADSNGIYDRVTGALVFEYGDLYRPFDYDGQQLCYFGGDKYLGFSNDEFRWVNLTDLSMSDPLPFPEDSSSLLGNMQMFILNDTYCVYWDQYGVFLWNYNDGTEETIMMFEN